MTAGYQVAEQVFTPGDVDDLIRALPGPAPSRSRAGVRHLMTHPAVRNAASDPRLLALATSALGSSAIPYRATLFDKSPDRNWLVVWHQDTALPLRGRRPVPGWGPWSAKQGLSYAHAPASALERVVALRLHLDASEPDNGPLRVIPDTHTMGVLTDAAIARTVAARDPVDCVAGAGGVVAMRPLILHASSKSASDRPRRVLHIEYIDALDLGDGLQIAIA